MGIASETVPADPTFHSGGGQTGEKTRRQLDVAVRAVKREHAIGSSRREEALTNFRFRISDFRLRNQSPLTSAATRVGIRAVWLDKLHNDIGQRRLAVERSQFAGDVKRGP